MRKYTQKNVYESYMHTQAKGTEVEKWRKNARMNFIYGYCVCPYNNSTATTIIIIIITAVVFIIVIVMSGTVSLTETEIQMESVLQFDERFFELLHVYSSNNFHRLFLLISWWFCLLLIHVHVLSVLKHKRDVYAYEKYF